MKNLGPQLADVAGALGEHDVARPHDLAQVLDDARAIAAEVGHVTVSVRAGEKLPDFLEGA